MANEKLLPSELNVKGTEAVEASIKDDLEVPAVTIWEEELVWALEGYEKWCMNSEFWRSEIFLLMHLNPAYSNAFRMDGALMLLIMGMLAGAPGDRLPANALVKPADGLKIRGALNADGKNRERDEDENNKS